MSGERLIADQEVLRSHLDPSSLGVSYVPDIHTAYIHLDNGQYFEVPKVHENPLRVETVPRKGIVKLLAQPAFVNDPPLINSVVTHYLTGDVIPPLSLTDQQITENGFARSVQTFDPRRNVLVVLGGSLVREKSDEAISISLPDTSQRYCDAVPDPHTFSYFDPEQNKILHLHDTEILGGYSLSSARNKLLATLAASLFAPAGVALPEVIMQGNLVDATTDNLITAIFPYIKPLTISFGEAVSFIKNIIQQRPDLIDQVNLAERMIYQFMRNKSIMQTKELTQEDLVTLNRIYPGTTYAKGIAHFLTHTGNWGCLFDNLRIQGREQASTYIGDWEGAYTGPLMRSELLVADTYFAFGKIIKGLTTEFKNLPNGDSKVLNIILYGLLGLKGVGVEDFIKEYRSLSWTFEKIFNKASKKKIGDVFSYSLDQLVLAVCKEVYGYDPFQDYNDGNRDALGGLIHQAMGNEILARANTRVKSRRAVR